VIRVLLADDQRLVRTGLRSILDDESDITVVGEVPDGRAALHHVAQLDPDVVLMGSRMPVLDGVTATASLTAAGSRARVLISPRTTSTNTSSRRCVQERTASCSRTPAQTTSWRGFAPSQVARECSTPV
jgi:DNA-binding NarL/FixJ family response regulator